MAKAATPKTTPAKAAPTHAPAKAEPASLSDLASGVRAETHSNVQAGATPHVVGGNVPYFDGSLHYPGATVLADGAEAGANLEPQGVTAHALQREQVEIAPIAPSSPGATAPQGVPPGAVQTPGGTFVAAGDPSTDGRPQEFVASTRDDDDD